MSVNVLVVDDSGFFRRRVCDILKSVSAIKVVGTASNGKEAVDLVAKLKPDVVTMDYEMPVMDGITAVKHIMASNPTPILMFSSLTYEGARVTLDALEAGAVDFLPKNFEDVSRESSQLQETLRERILTIARSRPRSAAPAPAPEKPAAPVRPATPETPATGRTPPQPRTARSAEPPKPRGAVQNLSNIQLVAIGTSTGGPIALQKILTRLPANFPKPILLIQHMPATFTPAFAERLNKLCQISVKQAEDGDVLRPGLALLAPGGKQMIIESRGGTAKVRILDGDDRLHYKPCVDVTFGSAARSFPGKTLGIILTGMGSDGKEGARMLKNTGAPIWSQDEKSCVIYGMPMAVAKAGLSDQVFSLAEFADQLVGGFS